MQIGFSGKNPKLMLIGSVHIWTWCRWCCCYCFMAASGVFVAVTKMLTYRVSCLMTLHTQRPPKVRREKNTSFHFQFASKLWCVSSKAPILTFCVHLIFWWLLLLSVDGQHQNSIFAWTIKNVSKPFINTNFNGNILEYTIAVSLPTHTHMPIQLYRCVVSCYLTFI